MIKQLNKNNFDNYIKDGLKFIAFSAPWCTYCKRQKPVLEELSNSGIETAEINADENSDIAFKYDIHAFPSFLLFKEGKMLAKFSGYRPKYDLLNTIMHYLR